MKLKRFVGILCLITIFISSLTGCKSKSEYTKVKLNEVAHSVFYAPMYVSIEEGYFKEEGLDVTLTNGLGADKTMTSLLSGECDIGFMGSESSIYVYKEGASDYVVNFAQLTQRAGNFLVSRNLEEEFSWDNIQGKTVLGGRIGGMPEMIFEYILAQRGVNSEIDVNIVKNIDFGLTAEAFASGQGDYTIEFEPSAYTLEKEGKGKVVASLGTESGLVPYTAFSARKSYIKKNPEVIQGFTNAIQKGLEYVATHSSEEVAQKIQPQFPEIDMEALIAIVERYHKQNTWKEDTIFETSSFELLEDILIQSGQLDNRVSYDDLVTTQFSEKAIS